jgi:Alginate export
VQKLGFNVCTDATHSESYPRFERIFSVLRWVCFLSVVCTVARGQVSAPTQEQQGTSLQRPTYTFLRFDEDWSFLQDRSLRTDVWDPIKYIPLHLDRPKEYLSIGGEFRGTYERVLNDNFSRTPFPNYSFGMQRFQLFADGHINPYFRFFIQFESGLEQGRSGGARPIDLKRLDFLNAFVELRFLHSENSPTFRIGRQELHFGSGRLVSVREGPNVRQGFYAIRVNEKIRRWTIDGFASEPAQDNPDFFDNAPLNTTKFWGVYSSHPWNARKGQSFDLYYFGIDRATATFNSGTAHELRHTIGGRLVAPAPVIGDSRRWLPHYDVEAIFQFGDFGSRDIRAWGIASEFGYNLPSLPLNPYIGLRADVNSGDSGNPHGPLGTFNPLFPPGGYFGVLNDTGLGPVNFRDLHPDLHLNLPHNITLDADWLIQWRQSLHDGLYDVPGNLLVPNVPTDARFVGHRPGLEARWQIDRHAYIQGDYGVFFAGSFLRAAGRPHNLNYTSVWVGYKF